ncbi:flagellar hook-length control protein FliK [Rhizobium populisoli]|uniref:flagellar hook-length control protein FliK n=1 Tax=Rhizobium populisoli TaxID=2859785 RepID=UPI001FE3133F|nr:flagellar hook-length control protein FliK [Rhizobium populisoli]
MITDILGSAKTGAADAASSAKAVAGRDANSKGFSNALSDLDRDEPQQDADIADDHHKPSSSHDQLASSDDSSRRKKPIVDIRPESLRRASLEQEATDAKQAAAGAKTNEPHMTLAEKKLREALAAAKAITQKADEQTGNKKTDETRGKNAERIAKEDKLNAQQDDDIDQSILAADDAKISDMLSMLGGSAQAEVGQGQVLTHKDARSQQVKHAKDDEDHSLQKDGIAVPEGGQTKRLHIVDPLGPDPLSMPSDAEVPGTKQFRFSNARDGQSMSMTVGEGQGDRNTVEFRQGANGAAENVTVLDSRRFLGLAPNSNSSNLSALMSGDSEWAAAMHPTSALSNAAIQSSTGNVVNTLKLQMNPHDLGSVMATLRLHGEELNVHLTVETRAAYRQLSEDSGGILDALRAQGFSVDQVTISIAPTADSDTNNSQQPGQNNQAGQQFTEGGRQGQAADRGQQQAGNNRQPADDRMRTTNEAVQDNAQAPASGGARPGQLYL